jgi:hypothetical protein
MTTDKARKRAVRDHVAESHVAEPRVAEPDIAEASGAPTAGNPLDEYLDGVDPARAPLVRELDRLVRTTVPELGAAVKYRMLTYAIEANWWRWVCAISVTKKAVNLRFLYGTRLDAGAGVLRSGTSHLATLDLLPDAPLDADLVTRLVREAVARHAGFLDEERSGRA